MVYLSENIVIHTIQLTSTEPCKARYPCEDVQDSGLWEVSPRNVQLLQGGTLLPLHCSHVVCCEAGLLELETAEILASLDQDLDGGPLHLGTVVDAQDCKLDTVGAECLNMSVIHKTNTPHVDDSKVGGGLLQCSNIEDLIDLSLLLLSLLIGPVQVEELHTIDEVVDLLHEVVKEDSFTQT